MAADELQALTTAPNHMRKEYLISPILGQVSHRQTVVLKADIHQLLNNKFPHA